MRLENIMQHKKKGLLSKIWIAALIFALAGGSIAGSLAGSLGDVYAEETSAASDEETQAEEELRGVWISYLTWEKLPSQKDAFEQAVDEMFDNCASWGMNAVFVHVRSHGDAMYPSQIFPWSKFVTGTQGADPGYDPLQYMVESAHKRGLQFHAWFNPFRVTGYLMPWSDVSSSSPAKKWLNDSDSSNDRYVLLHDGAYYYNPSSETVKQMIVDGVMEVVRGYDVDGIHFDDYFYPELDDDSSGRWFDKPEYLASGSSLSIADWRRNNITDLLSRVYQAIKAEKPDVMFGVSPEGYVDRLRSDNRIFLDIDRITRWPGYVDYVMPQIYWGFEAKDTSGNTAPYSFDQNLQTWIDLTSSGNVKLYLGLAMYKAGTNENDRNEVSEWLRYDDIISREVKAGRNSGRVSGYCFYSYESFKEPEAQKEVTNLIPLLK